MNQFVSLVRQRFDDLSCHNLGLNELIRHSGAGAETGSCPWILHAPFLVPRIGDLGISVPNGDSVRALMTLKSKVLQTSRSVTGRSDVSGRILSQMAFTLSSYLASPAALDRASSKSYRRNATSHFQAPPQAGPSKLPARRVTGERSVMRITRGNYLAAATGLLLAYSAAIVPSQAQTAADAAMDLAKMLDGGGSIVSSDAYLSALESDAAAGRPMALWQLGTMYENGEGVDRDPARAFGYFAQIANQHADAAPRSLEADIVARSFVKLGEDYYRLGAPEAGIAQNPNEYHRVLLHAATYFGDAEAQYRVGMLYQREDGLGVSPMLSARWLQSAAHKGHCLGQAQLGNLLFNGMDNYPPREAEGLMWLNQAHETCRGSMDQALADDLLHKALSVASPEARVTGLSITGMVEGEQVSN
jgi:TPR repeat protein